MKKALALAALLAFLALPSMASANWTHKGKGELAENASLTLSGELTLSTSAGNVSCPTTVGATLTASSSAGDVSSFTVSEPSKCDLTGSLGAICGTHGLTKVEKTGTWTLAADETDITLSSIDVHYVLAGCLIPSFRLKGSATASLDKPTAIGKATLSGTQTLYNSLGEESGSGELKGTLSVSPAGTYGVKTGATVETKWTDSDEHLSEDGKLTLSGTFSFSGSGGSVSCPATVKLSLESSTVEEEEPEGQLESFAVAKPSECDVGGTLGTLCGTNSVSSVEPTGTASLTTNEEDIAVTGLVLDYKFTGCAVTSLRVEGNPTISVNDPGAIASATFSAGALQIYNASGEKTGTAEAGGSASASPSGTYQLASDAAETEATETAETEETETEATETEETEETETAETDANKYMLTGELTTTVPGAILGSCGTSMQLTVLGEVEGHDTAEVTEFEIVAPGEGCHGTFAGGAITCPITEAGPIGLPWHVDIGGAPTNVDITGSGFFMGLQSPCPSILGFEGSTTASFNNSTHCLEFEEDGDLKVIGSGASVSLDGEVCDPTETLELE